MEQIKSVNDLMASLQEEILAVKIGKLSESAARVMFRGRALQLKTVELSLQHARLRRSLQPEQSVLLLNDGNESKGRKRPPKRAKA